MFSRCFLDFSVDVGAFVLGLSQISAFFSTKKVSETHCFAIYQNFTISRYMKLQY